MRGRPLWLPAVPPLAARPSQSNRGSGPEVLMRERGHVNAANGVAEVAVFGALQRNDTNLVSTYLWQVQVPRIATAHRLHFAPFQLGNLAQAQLPDASISDMVMGCPITSTLVVADRGVLRIWRWVSLPEGGQKFWFQRQLADTAWLACARVAATRSAAERPSNAPTQSHSLQRSHPHLNSIFASKLHARGPLHWVICIRRIRWHGVHLQAVALSLEVNRSREQHFLASTCGIWEPGLM